MRNPAEGGGAPELNPLAEVRQGRMARIIAAGCQVELAR